MKRILSLLAFGFLVAFTTYSCVDKTFDEPPYSTNDPNIQTNSDIKSIKSLFKFEGFVQITEDKVFSAVVIANDSTGNFYKKIIVQDATGGLEILLDAKEMYTKFPVGRRVFIKAKGLYLGDYNGVIQLGYLPVEGAVIAIPFKDVDNFIVGGSLNNVVTPKTLQLGSYTDDDVNTLVKFENVEFDKGSALTTFADGVYKNDASRTLINCTDSSLIIRTSGYAKFAGDPVPKKNGTFVCVLGKYNTEYQGYIRSLKDINFTNTRCTGDVENIALYKDFNDKSVTSGGWKIKNVIGNITWTAVTRSTRTYGNITNYVGGANNQCDTWLISPQVDISTLEYPSLNFVSACNYNGDNIEVYVTQNYDGTSLPDDNNWTLLDATISSGGWVWTDSGIIDLSPYKSKKIYVAFRYLGSATAGKTWEIDDISISNTKPKAKLFNDDFESGSLSKWNSVSVKGDQIWGIDASHGNPGGCAKVSGYSGGNKENEDWLISPILDLTSLNSCYLTFDNAKNYAGNDVELFVSKNYSGSGDPNSATWTPLSYTKSTGTWTYVNSGAIDLSSYKGSKIYVGFKYTSTTSASSTWEIDNVKVFE